MITNIKILLITIFTVLLSDLCFADETVYVQSYKAKLYSAPNLSSEPLQILNRGARLVVIKKQENWYQVFFGKKTGWVYAFSVASRPMDRQNKLLQALPQQGNNNKPRRQASSIPTAAAIRGLDEPENKDIIEDSCTKLED